jgi:hypothetical protein
MGGTGSGRRAGCLSPLKARAIYAAAHGPNTVQAIARYFRVSPRTVLDIKHRRTYAAHTESLYVADEALLLYMQSKKRIERNRRVA